MVKVKKNMDALASGPKELSVRLSFGSPEPTEIKRWVQWLSESGLSVVGASDRGIDVRGNVAAIESALETTIEMSEGRVPLIGDVRKTVGRSSKKPTAYIPQKPRFFP